MKTLILASAAVLSLGIGSAFAATANTQQGQQQVALNAQSSGSQSGSLDNGQQVSGQAYGTHTQNGYIGGYQPQPPDALSEGD